MHCAYMCEDGKASDSCVSRITQYSFRCRSTAAVVADVAVSNAPHAATPNYKCNFHRLPSLGSYQPNEYGRHCE